MSYREKKGSFDQLRARHRLRSRRRLLTIISGLVMLFSGFALLGVSPDTRSDWTLIRVFAGFGLLVIGFGLAVLPILSRITGGDE